MKALLIYAFVVNIFSFLLFGIDKLKAKKDLWRIPEWALLFVALIGGSPGSLVGMWLFRHKTKHLKFIILVPLFFILHLILIYYFIQQYR